MVWLKRECTCGQESRYCVADFEISGPGVIHQRSSDLIKCGKVKAQIKACAELFDKTKATPPKEEDV